MREDYLTAKRWSKQICEKLGIDPFQVSRIVIDLTPNDMATLFVTFVGTEDLLDIELPDPRDIRIVMGKQGHECNQ